MKWIGQHIWDFISRFRSDVYLEDISDAGSDTDKFLVAESDGKVSYRTGAEVLSDIGAASSASDITAVTITTDSGGGSRATDDSGSADFSILGATGVGVTNSGTTITATAVPGEIDHDSLSNFVAAEHYRWDTDIASTATIHTENITDLHGAGVDGSDNQLLTDAGNGKITSESTTSLSTSVSTTRLRLISPANSLDFLQIDTTTNGATTLTTVDGDAALANFEIAADGNIILDAAGDVALECGSNGFTCDAGNIDFSSSGANRPTLQMINSEDDATGPSIILKNNRDGSGLEDDDILGEIKFVGEDALGNFEQYGGIIGSVVESADGDEAGQIAISVANEGTERNGITMTADKGTAEEVDVTIANGTSSTTTIAGDLTVTSKATIPTRKFAISSGTDGNAIGDVVYFGGTTSMTVGKIYHYKSDGTWEIANADAVATSDGLLGVALGAASDTNGMLLRGMVTLDHDPGAIGDVLYVQSDNAGTPGDATVTAPSASGDCIRVIGYCVHASAGNVWFNPDNTFVEHA